MNRTKWHGFARPLAPQRREGPFTQIKFDDQPRAMNLNVELSDKLNLFRQRRAALTRHGRQGQALVEFAMIALVLYLLIAGVLEFGRAIYVAQGLQSAADLLARELSRTPLSATTSLDALNLNNRDKVDPTVKSTIFDPSKLQVPIDSVDVSTWPPVNQLLYPLMVVSSDFSYLEYPGLVTDGDGDYAFNVLNSDGSISTTKVIEPIYSDPSDPTKDTAFSLVPPSSSPPPTQGIVALRINYPFHAAALSSYRYTNASGSVPLDQAIGQNGISNSAVQSPDALQAGQAGGPYSGASKLGQQAAMGVTAAPFSRTISAQAVYRREVFTSP